MSKQIPLTQGKFAIVDDEDYEWLMQYKWCVCRKKYAVTRPMKDGKQITIYMRRLVMNAPNDKQVDHVNMDGFDNRRVNLRICSNSENHMNSRINSRNTTGYKGVGLRKDIIKNKFRVYISINGKRTTIGYFYTAKEAAIAYNDAALKYYGRFARLNDIPE